MGLPLPVSYPPMEAKLVAELPSGAQWLYEPKFDGFRCLAFKDGGEVDLRSKSGQPFNRYFPEVVAALSKLRPGCCVLDGELVVPDGDALSFDALQRFFERHGRSAPLLRLSPQTVDRRAADAWLLGLGTGLDGVMAKRLDLPYQSGARTGMQKFKRMRSADCVVGGFRYAAKARVVGSLLLGLYDDAGLLHHVGFTSNIKEDEKPALTKKLEKLVGEPGFTGNRPGGPSRWSTERSGEWESLETKLVVEVQYDHFSGGRFRHGTRLRWCPDKALRQCTLKQVAQESEAVLALLQ